MSPLSAWTNFYVITGSSAGALTGLMFVAMTLIASARWRTSGEPASGFATPTLVHFSLALFISALVSAPWPATIYPSVILGLTGVGGLIYALIAARRIRRQADYQPVLEDWLWYALVPVVAYAVLIAMAIVLASTPTPALFGIAAITLALLFIGIHNAWDTVVYITFEHLRADDEENEQGRAGEQQE